jgi:hypothetical protein
VSERPEGAPHPQTPPTQRGPGAKAPSVWPAVIGVIAIVFGSLGALGGAWGAFSPLLLRLMASVIPDDQAASLEVMRESASSIVVLSVAALVLGVLLLAGGVGLCRRRSWGPKVCLIWAGLKLLHVVFNSVWGYMIQQAQFQQLVNEPNMPAAFGGMMQVIGAFTIVLGIVWGWALPLFMLVWLTRKSIRAEVAGWPSRQSPAI